MGFQGEEVYHLKKGLNVRFGLDVSLSQSTYFYGILCYIYCGMRSIYYIACMSYHSICT